MNGFQKILAEHALELTRARTSTLQVNVGFLCNLACRHCHVEAGPGRTEIMDRGTMEQVIAFAKRSGFKVIDITGGAPELVPDIGYLLEQAAGLADTVMLRTNLVALMEKGREELLGLCRDRRITLVASFPSTNEGQADAQRGRGVWQKSVAMLKELNKLGYGRTGTGLDLFLVANPAGAFLPVDQCAAEKKFKTDLARKWNIDFTGLYTFANMPLGRFRAWLEQSGNLEAYMARLKGGFNPATISGLMCRSLVSVSWDGILYDCDFNLAAGLPCGGSPVHVSEAGKPEPGVPIMTDTWCFACTAGSGFT